MEQLRLENHPFPILMKEIMEAKFSGIVFLASEQWRKGLIFNEGRLCAIQSNKPGEFLGYILIGLGKISAQDNASSLEKARTDRVKQGYILLERGLIQPDDLAHALRHQIEKRFLDIFSWKKGTIQQVQKTIDKSPELGLEELAFLVRKGVKELLPFSSVIDAFSPYAGARPKQMKDDLPKESGIDMQKITPQTVSEILLIGQETARSLLGLYCTGYVCFEESEHQALIEQLKKTLKEIKEKDPLAVLGVDNTISDGGLKRMYIRLVKANHPDAYSHVEDTEVKRLANDIFTEIQKAYDETLRIREGKPPEKKGIDENIQAELIYAQATDAMKAKDYQKAMDMFRLCVNMRPNERVFAESYIKTMFLRWQATGAGNSMEIKVNIGDAAKRFPNSDIIYIILGWVLKQEGSVKAVEAFRKALEINPNNLDAQREIRLYQMRGRT
jgi:tetratricopeptide (TPR) repeat protein